MERRALSPVIAAILMIIVVVALVIILYGFSVGMLGGTTTAATEAGTGMTGSTATGIIEAVDTTNSFVYIRSTNDVGSEVDSAYVDGTRTTIDDTCAGGDATLAATGTMDLNMPQCSVGGQAVTANQTIVVTGSNNFRATGKS
ncbi:MAG: hypothetical protein GOV15_02065 [Candidatus Diapherotrites archaeon]|nr:hypothetical protein [Candidatus Diapherotrites archaeon]